jgi:nitrogen fixation/metabolism regulation signal transduction histidine kinase
MEGRNSHGPVSREDVERLKHDIKNQLSNIQLALEALKFEIDTSSDDIALYLDGLGQSADKIDKLLTGF